MIRVFAPSHSNALSVFYVQNSWRMACQAPKIIVTNRIPALAKTPTKYFVCRSHDGAPFLRLKACPQRLGNTKLHAAGIAEIEPDLSEEKQDRWETNSISADDFKYGEYDDHHTYHEGHEEKVGFWEAVKQEYDAAEPPTGFQGLISWLFLPAIVAGLAFDVQGEYLYIGAAVFVAVFCGIEMAKPDKPHNFEPEIYNMERGARDKLIEDYNTMDIWDFNEKYGDLWDFTVEEKP